MDWHVGASNGSQRHTPTSTPITTPTVCSPPSLPFSPSLTANHVTAALEDKLATLSVEQREVLEKDLAKKEKKEDAKAEREKARIAVSRSFGVMGSEADRLGQASKVTIKRIERNKRKFITGVHGLESFGESWSVVLE
jgi:translation initiation factor 1 (eIF-1/SUI1)